VNKGAGSLEVLRWAAATTGRVKTVLGNHDLHLLARAEGCAKERRGDTLDSVLTAPDREKLLGWLRRRPFLLERRGVVVVHAGVLPGWGLGSAQKLARRCRTALSNRSLADLLRDARDHRKAGLPTKKSIPAVVSVLTTLRVVNGKGDIVYGFDGAPADRPVGTRPWFEASRVVRTAKRVVFGHWANLGLYLGEKVVCLDAGCVYGGDLCAFRVDDGKIVKVGCAADDRTT
jgi:bis(5'-nucleosyl)-tetraphosphatase (symmetrical)